MLLQRALVTLTLGPLTLLLIYLGGWYYFAAFAALLVIATIEYTQLVGKLGWQSPLWILLPAVILQWILPLDIQDQLFGNNRLTIDLTALALLAGVLVSLLFALWLFEKRPEENAPASWMTTVAGIILLGWMGSHYFHLRGIPEQAIEWTSLAMLGTWIADSGAYVFGKTLGRHKLAPKLSPHKTIEGYIGGVVSAVPLTMIIAYFLGLRLDLALILGILISVVSPAGDLGISMLKRACGVKDSGKILPGHGGALDRTDSLTWSVAMAYYLLVLVG